MAFQLKSRILDRVQNASRKNILPGLQPGDYICYPVPFDSQQRNYPGLIRPRRDHTGRLHEEVDVVARVVSINCQRWQPGGSSDLVGLIILGPKALLPKRWIPVSSGKSGPYYGDLPIDWPTVSATEWLLDRNFGLHAHQVRLRDKLKRHRSPTVPDVLGDRRLPTGFYNRRDLQQAYFLHRQPLFPSRLLRSGYWILFNLRDGERSSRDSSLRWGYVQHIGLRPPGDSRTKVLVKYRHTPATAQRANRTYEGEPAHNLLAASQDNHRRRSGQIMLEAIRCIVDGVDLDYISYGRNPQNLDLQKWDYVVYYYHGNKYAGWGMDTPSARGRMVKIWSEKAPCDFVATDDNACGLRTSREWLPVDRGNICARVQTAHQSFSILTPIRGLRQRETVHVIAYNWDLKEYTIVTANIAWAEEEMQVRLSTSLGKHWLFHKNRPANDMYWVVPNLNAQASSHKDLTPAWVTSQGVLPAWYSRRNIFLARQDAQARLDLYYGNMDGARWCRKLLEGARKEHPRSGMRFRSSYSSSSRSGGGGFSGGGDSGRTRGGGGGSGGGGGGGGRYTWLSGSSKPSQGTLVSGTESARANRRRMREREAEEQAAIDAELNAAMEAEREARSKAKNKKAAKAGKGRRSGQAPIVTDPRSSMPPMAEMPHGIQRENPLTGPARQGHASQRESPRNGSPRLPWNISSDVENQLAETAAHNAPLKVNQPAKPPQQQTAKPQKHVRTVAGQRPLRPGEERGPNDTLRRTEQSPKPASLERRPAPPGLPITKAGSSKNSRDQQEPVPPPKAVQSRPTSKSQEEAAQPETGIAGPSKTKKKNQKKSVPVETLDYAERVGLSGGALIRGALNQDVSAGEIAHLLRDRDAPPGPEDPPAKIKSKKGEARAEVGFADSAKNPWADWRDGNIPDNHGQP